MSTENESHLDYVDMMARPDLCHIKIGERRIDMTPKEAKAVALLLGGYADLQWRADADGHPEPVGPGEDAGTPPTKRLPPGLWLRPLQVDQPQPGERFSAKDAEIVNVGRPERDWPKY